jgi:hypothetical protein
MPILPIVRVTASVLAFLPALGLPAAAAAGAWDAVEATGVSLAAGGGTAPGGIDRRLAARLDPETARAVSACVDSARVEGLPTEPLVQRALEGATKQAGPPRIEGAVRALLHRLRVARSALGPAGREEEIVAGASALQAGVPDTTIARLRRSRPDRSLAVPLVVLADLIARGVPGEAAASMVVRISRAGVGDDRLLDFRKKVEKDILSGASPGSAARIRANGLVPGAGNVPASPARRAS